MPRSGLSEMSHRIDVREQYKWLFEDEIVESCPDSPIARRSWILVRRVEIRFRDRDGCCLRRVNSNDFADVDRNAPSMEFRDNHFSIPSSSFMPC